MKRFKQGDRSRYVSWPKAPSGPFDNRGVFESRHPYRRIRVMIDAELLDASGDADGRLDLLRILVEHDLVDLHRFADLGPPGYQPAGPSNPQPPVYPGWAILEPWDGGWGVLVVTESGHMLAGIQGNADQVAAADVNSQAYIDLPTDDAVAHRRRDAIAAQVASQALQADVYVTERPYLHEVSWEICRHSAVCTIDEALALLGLYFRSQGEYVVARAAHPVRYNRGLFTWVGTRALLPAAWRWLSACSQSDIHSGADSLLGEDSLYALGESLLTRVERALAARDELYIAVNRPQHNDTADDLLTALDELLVALVAAFDVTARVTHRVLRLAGQEHRVAWQRTDWLADVNRTAPALAAVMAEHTPGSDCFTIVRLLRNYVHGQALRSAHVQRSGHAGRNLVRMPAADVSKLLPAIERQGGQHRWGVEPAAIGAPFADPVLLADAAFELVIPTLNQIMDTTPVEQLPGVQLRPELCQPPVDQHGKFGPDARRSIRWQYGFDRGI